MRSILLLWGAGCVAALAGCGGSYEATVSGTVTLDGQPLALGRVAFVPSAGGPTAYGSIDTGGSYTVHTGGGRGMAPGEYIVTVLATETPPTDNPAPQGQVSEAVGKQLTPPKYASAKQSDLRAHVVAGSNRFDFELVSN